jgi:hypothetical protein
MAFQFRVLESTHIFPKTFGLWGVIPRGLADTDQRFR